MKDFFASYRRSPQISGSSIGNSGLESLTGLSSNNANEIKDKVSGEVQTFPTQSALEGLHSCPCVQTSNPAAGLEGLKPSPEKIPTRKGVSQNQTLQTLKTRKNNEVVEAAGEVHTLYLKEGAGDEGDSAGVYELLCAVRVVEDGRLAISPSNQILKSQWQQLNRSQRAVRALLPLLLLPEEVRESAERMRVVGQRWLRVARMLKPFEIYAAP